MGILRGLRNRLWGKNLPVGTQAAFFPDEAPSRSQICATIVTYNIGKTIHCCFDSIECQVGHILIVDNGSDDATRQELAQLANSDHVTLILNNQNEGVARAYNQAVRWAREKGFQWLLTLDHDSEAAPGMIDGLVQGYNNVHSTGTQNIGIVAPLILDVNSQEYLCSQPHATLPFEEGAVLSSGSLIWLGVFDAVGMFNEDLFIYYVDNEFCRRLGNAGYSIYICPGASLLHREGSKKRHKFLWLDRYYDHYGRESRYYITRNTIYVIKHIPGINRNDFRSLVTRLWEDHLNILLFDRERLSIFWFSLRGLVDGLRGKAGPLHSRCFESDRTN